MEHNNEEYGFFVDLELKYEQPIISYKFGNKSVKNIENNNIKIQNVIKVKKNENNNNNSMKKMCVCLICCTYILFIAIIFY